MLAELDHDHSGVSGFYYLDVSLEETLRRHATRPEAAEPAISVTAVCIAVAAKPPAM